MKQATAPLIYPGSRTPWEAQHAKRGQLCEVVREFEDADGDLHEVGDRWTLLGTGFNKFEDLMWLGVRATDATEWLLPLDWTVDSQSDVLEHWSTYVRPAG